MFWRIVWGLVGLAVVFLLVGVGAVVWFFASIERERDAVTASVIADGDKIVAEAEQLMAAGAPANGDFPLSTLPPTIAGLNPQWVQLERYSDSTLLDVQVTGGFGHFGYLIGIDLKHPIESIPHSSYSRTKIHPRIVEYRE